MSTSANMSNVRMTTTDNFQGEESHIVLLSLVRSNKEGKAGFVKTQNRVCVGLSRARDGMYVIGNFEMLKATSELWSSICNGMEMKGRIGSYLTLQCSVHEESPNIQASTASDFDRSPHGGCLRPCKTVKSCGHTCSLLCHPISHDLIHCTDPCMKPRPISCPHKCRKACWEVCGPCSVPVKKFRQFCGHTISICCHENVDSVACSSKCGVMMLCGHNCPEMCHLAGHDKLRYKCPLPCSRTRADCSHACPKMCHEPCGSCNVMVTRVLPCGHTVMVECSVDTSTLVCRSICDKVRPSCGHTCTHLCGLDCESVECTVEVEKLVGLCNDSPKHRQRVACSSDASQLSCDIPCGETLACGHVCTGSCNSCVPLGSFSMKREHTVCKNVCSRILDCNHVCNGSHECGNELSDCPPCLEPCAIACSHRKCELQCGEACEPCIQKCEFKSDDFACVALCGEAHVLFSPVSADSANKSLLSEADCHILCKKKCLQKLPSCQHSCLGLCGELCPNVCGTCSIGKIKDRILRLPSPALAADIPRPLESSLIELACGHSFEVTAFDEYMSKFTVSNDGLTGEFRALKIWRIDNINLTTSINTRIDAPESPLLPRLPSNGSRYLPL